MKHIMSPSNRLARLALGLKELTDIPNRDGFRFIGRTRDNRDVDCEVRKNALGWHYVHFINGDAIYGGLVGWKDAVK